VSLTTAQKLAEARDALHRLETGGQAVKVSVDGVSTEFAAPDVARLRAYIRELEALTGTAPRRALRVTL